MCQPRRPFRSVMSFSIAIRSARPSPCLRESAGPVAAAAGTRLRSRRSTAAQDRRGSVRGFGRLRGCARGCPSGRNAGATNARVSRAGRSTAPLTSTCRQRASQLRRFAEWLDGPGAGAASLADAVDAYAESRFRAGASVATVAGDLGAIRWYAGASGSEAAASLGAASLGDAKRDHDRRRRGRGQAAALRWAAADQVARRAARDGTPKGLRDAALVAGHARPLRPPGGRQPGSRRHPPADRSDWSSSVRPSSKSRVLVTSTSR